MAARIVSGKQAKALLSMTEAIEVNAAAFILHAAGSVVNPERLIVRGRDCFNWLRVIACLSCCFVLSVGRLQRCWCPARAYSRETRAHSWSASFRLEAC